MPVTIADALKGMASGAAAANTPAAQGAQERKTAAEAGERQMALAKLLRGEMNPDGSYKPGVEEAADEMQLGKKADLELQKEKNEMQAAMGGMDQYGNQNPGHKAQISVGPHGVSVQEAQQNAPLLALRMGPQQAQGALKAAQAAYKPLNEQQQAAQATVSYLDKGDAVNDKLALLSEARLAAGQGGSRALKSIMDTLSGGRTGAMDFQGAINYLQNTPNVSTLQPGQRDAIRESAYGRLDDIQTLGDQTEQQLRQQGPLAFPMANTDGIVDTFSKPFNTNMNGLRQRAGAYKAQMQQTQQQQGTPPVAQPSTASPNPTALQSLGSFFKGLGGQRAQQAQAQQPTVAPTATNTSRGGTPLQPQQTPGNSGVGQGGQGAQTMRVKHKASGQTGTIPVSEYDPSTYDQVQ